MGLAAPGRTRTPPGVLHERSIRTLATCTVDPSDERAGPPWREACVYTCLMTASLESANSASLRVLVIDDEPNIRSTVSVCLESMGCEVHAAAGAREALAIVERRPFDVAFLDIRLGAADGLEVLGQILDLNPNLGVVMMTAYGSIESAVTAMKRGAQDYLQKPFTPAQIRVIVERLAERRGLENRIADLEGRLATSTPQVLLETSSSSMQSAIDVVTQAAKANSPILLRGESGTGKGVLARLAHELSPRRGRRLVTVNCPTLTDDLLASDLFGHARGAFNGAVRDQRGKVEEADGGTLFLDEIGEISPALQTKLLRFAQDREFERVGETQTRQADVRLVAATNRDLQADVEQGRFRLDLLYRLNVIEVVVPALRERPEDLVRLAQHFLRFAASDAGRPAPRLNPEAQALLLAYQWPGNVRELKNEMERAVVLSADSLLTPQSFSERIRGGASVTPRVGGDFTLAEVEQEHTLRVLARLATRDEAARVLGIDPSTLWRRLKRYETGGQG